MTLSSTNYQSTQPFYPTAHCIKRCQTRGIPWSAIIAAYASPAYRKSSTTNPHAHIIVGRNGVGFVLTDDHVVLTAYRKFASPYPHGITDHEFDT